MSKFITQGLSIFAGKFLNKWGLPFSVTPTGEERVQTSPRPRLIETFDSGAWDTINRWIISNGGGGVLPSASVGTGTLSSGTTLNGFSKVTTLNTPAGGQNFKLTEPGYNLFEDRIQVEFPVLTTGHRFWGSGTSSATPTIAAPLIQAMGWEITTAGQLTPVVYQSGTRVPPGGPNGPILTDSFAQLSDGNTHKYYRWFAGSIGFWCLDSPDNIVAYYLTGASGPDINGLPLLYQAISNGSTAVTLSIAGLNVAETADTSSVPLLNNGAGGYEEQRSNLDANSALLTLTAAGAGTVNSAQFLNINGRGIALGINTTVDTAGAYVVNLQALDVVSGIWYTIASSPSITAAAFSTLTLYPGITAAANVSVNAALPRTYRVQAVVTTGPITATIGASVIV